MTTQSILNYLPHLWQALILPLSRVLFYLSVGLLLANLVEALNWSRHMAKLSRPLARFSRLGELSGASFSLAFFSAQASNALLAEGVEQGRLTRRELILSNLFNSSPTFLVHLPTLMSLSFSLLGTAAFSYIGLTFAGAVLRTLTVIVFGRLFLPPTLPTGPTSLGTQTNHEEALPKRKELKEIWRNSLKRFQKRLRKLLIFTIPIYVVLFVIHELGGFALAETWMKEHLNWLSFIRPEALGVIALSLAAESHAALAAAGALLHKDTVAVNEIILALLVGNILSSPMRALRHQFPAYAGYFAPKTALHLVLANQALRAFSLIVVAWLYMLFGVV